MFISFTISVSKHLSFGLGLCDKSKFMDVMMNFFNLIPKVYLYCFTPYLQIIRKIIFSIS